MYKKYFSLLLIVLIISSINICAFADINDNTFAPYLQVQSPYVISDKTPKDYFISTLLSKELVDSAGLEPDLQVSTKYIIICADKCGLTEYGTFNFSQSSTELMSFLVSNNGFKSSNNLQDAEIGDVIFYGDCPGVVVKNNSVLFANKDSQLFLKSIDDIENGTVVKIIYPYYEQLALIYMINDLNYSRAKAIGILANLHFESLCDPTSEEKSNRMGFGIAQWSKDRRIDLEFYALENDKNLVSIFTQLDFMEYELSTKTEFKYLNYTLNHFSNDEDDAYDAAFIFCEEYEKPDYVDDAAIERSSSVLLTFYPLYGELYIPE